jgi:hypothetical protein
MIPDYAGFRFGIILFQSSFLFRNHLLQKKSYPNLHSDNFFGFRDIEINKISSDHNLFIN